MEARLVSPSPVAYIPLAPSVAPGDRPLMMALPVDCFQSGACEEASPLKRSADRQSEDAAAGTVRQLMQDLTSVRNRCQAVRGDWQAAGRDFDDAYNELRWSRFPLQRAERDNDRTDVSFEGREIDRHFRDTRRELDSASHDLQGAQFDLDQINAATGHAKKTLATLVHDLSQDEARYGPALGHLRQAAESLDAAAADFSRSDSSTDRAWSEARDVERDLDFNQHLVQDIVFDRPGRDVSYSARRLSSRRDWMEWNLSAANREVRGADSDGASADRRTAEAQEALARALTELTRLG